ncbi:hypothetical protein GBL_0116 [Geobacillus kaustophilus GBlys]|uniref:Uncharacterized protein n=1 Tax=Geobacillus kaustophilus GBlys TaxID=1337888 RepID=U2XZ70_GEOKU|nr:hypothetical protein GBL_0116 [Geobacillus kaustophilus GBlys]GAJ57814.1 hypothetical protein B23_1020 [Geobacillus thermoleovorans B23]
MRDWALFHYAFFIVCLPFSRFKRGFVSQPVARKSFYVVKNENGADRKGR